ncbi:transposase family protein [Pseudomonas syringae pv. syringae]|uniref:transposase family protein n=1 Tax=Pseudomonas syringae TaxID=317 RepID=UPI0023F6E869|nr:transposase family protein [Pseudomonas syringae]MDF5890046.1 transposase family protein [Pseudomonas syringae pv. syringae]
MAKVNVTQVTSAAEHLNAESTSEEIKRHQLATHRYPMIKSFLEGDISAKKAAKAIGLQLAAFYRLAQRAKGSLSYRSIVSRKIGRPQGAVSEIVEIETLIQQMTDKHYVGKAANFAYVWTQCQAEADRRGIKRPGYSTVRRRILSLGKREMDLRKHGTDYVNEKYGPKPGYKETSRPLEWVQIDHTVVDLIIVDSVTRKVIGRPWLSLAVCLHTRVILGFYLSLLPPSAVTVAMLVENCVMPKDRLLAYLKLPGHYWPMHGLVEVFHADNAKEFISDVFSLNLESYGVRVKHRVIGRKFEGGHIESLIGKFMTKKIHFLRGTTYSNTVMRKGTNSAKKAVHSFEELQAILVCNIFTYHETKHSGIGMTPAQKWAEHYDVNPPAKTVPLEEQNYFRYLMFPEVAEKLVSDKGIQFNKRFYYSSELKYKIQEKVLIKFDPYDLSYLLVKLNGKLVKIPCVRNQWGRSDNWEVCRYRRQQKSDRNGTVSKEGVDGIHTANSRAEESRKKTADAKKAAKKAAGVEQHKNHSAKVSGHPPEPEAVTGHAPRVDGLSEGATTTPAPQKHNKKRSYNFQEPDKLPASPKKSQAGVVLDIGVLLSTETGADFAEDIVIY